MKWYPKRIKPKEMTNIELDPEIKALPSFQYGQVSKSGYCRCPVCDGHKQRFDKVKDIFRPCLGCNGSGKVLLKR
jgi:hypothetical protein